MDRRAFLAFLAALPFVGRLVRETEPDRPRLILPEGYDPGEWVQYEAYDVSRLTVPVDLDQPQSVVIHREDPDGVWHEVWSGRPGQVRFGP